MYRVEIPENVYRFTVLLYRIGLWHRQDEKTVDKIGWKICYSIYLSLFTISVAAGAAGSDDKDEEIFSVLVVLVGVVFQVKLLYLIWKRKEILKLSDQICNYSVDDRETYETVNVKSTILKNNSVLYLSLCYITISCILFVAPFVGTERKLFFRFGYPLFFGKSEFGFWMEFTFLATESAIVLILITFSVFVWYLMANCSWRFEVLGSKMKKMGEIAVDESANEREISLVQRNYFYNRDLVEATKSYNDLKKKTNRLISFLTNLFVAQLTTSAICICISIYSLTFIWGKNSVKLLIILGYLVYILFDIFTIMYLGNEIKLASGRLSYNLYESNWIDRSQSIKKNVIFFGEFLLQPYQLMILKLYPLTLETFSRILNSAYTMFSVLKNVQ